MIAPPYGAVAEPAPDAISDAISDATLISVLPVPLHAGGLAPTAPAEPGVPISPPVTAGYPTAVTLVIANMIGTGVFTSLGFQVLGITSGFALLALWIVGGIVALCGALAYAELGAMIPRSGGEYRYLSRAFGPTVGRASGWVSVTVGFAAPIALAAIALGRYAEALSGVPATITAISTIIVITLIHSADVSVGERFQVSSTLVKLLLIVMFCAVGLAVGSTGSASFKFDAQALHEIASPAFAVALIYVSYAFSGWNAATYIASEIERPQQVIPRALLHGTALVTVLYVLLNYVFLRVVPIPVLAGKVEVGALAATRIFGVAGGSIMSGMLCLLLLSTVSAMTFAGPRVVRAMAVDEPALEPLARLNRRGAPRNAIFLQQGIALLFVTTGSFDTVLAYAAFTLNTFTLLTVTAVYVLRRREPDAPRPYRTWGYPVVPMLFIAVSLWTLGFVFVERPLASIAALATAFLAGMIQPRGSAPRTT